MNLHPSSILVVALGVVLGVLLPGEPLKPGVRKRKAASVAQVAGPRTSAWGDTAFLATEWDQACTFAKGAIGRDFQTRPTIVVTSTEAMTPIIAKTMATWLRSVSPEPEALAATVAKMTPVFNEVAENKVHVVPGAVENLRSLYKDPQLLPTEACRLLLVHAAVRALDAELFPALGAALVDRTEKDALEAAWAVAVGHASFRTQYIASPQNLNLEKVFDEITGLASRPLPEGGSAAEREQREAYALLLRASWVKGLSFIREIYTQKAPLREVLEAPPQTMTLIERPDIYLGARRLLKAFDEERILKELRKAVEREGVTVSSSQLARAEVEALLSAADTARVSTAMATLREAQVLRAVDEAGAVVAEAWLILLGDEKPADTFLELRRAHDQEMERRLADTPTAITGTSYVDGAGRDGGLPGYVVRRTETSPDGDHKVVQQVTREGPYVIQLRIVDNWIGREAQDDALEAAAEGLIKLMEKPKPRR